MPRDIDSGFDELGFATTPQAVMPTAQERGQAALDALPQHIKDAIASGKLTPSYESVRVRDGRGGEGYEANGDLRGFTSLDPNDIETSYDLAGNVTGTRQVDRTGGWIGRLTPGLTMAALAAMGGAGISNLLGAGAGAGTAAGGEGVASLFGGYPSLEASEMAAYTNATGAGAGLNAAAGLAPASAALAPHLTPAAIESLMGSAGYGTNSAALAAAPILGADAALIGSGAAIGASAIPAALSASAIPAAESALSATEAAKAAAAKSLLGGNKSSLGAIGGGLGLAALLASMNKKSGTDDSYKGTIPEYTASRTQTPTSETRQGINGAPYRPGQGGVTYFSPTTYTPKAAGGGLMGLANGGVTPGQYNLGSYSDGGRLLKGPGDGVSDSIPAVIGQKQPARLATGEFVIPARIVSELGNGSTDAGAKRLYEMMNRIQQTRRKTKNVAANTNAAKYLPA